MFDLIRAADVALEWLHGWPDFGRNLIKSILLASADHDTRSFARKGLRDRPAYAAARSCDDRNFSVQVAHNESRSLMSFLRSYISKRAAAKAALFSPS
jgi:hypothetical protein